MKKFSFLVLLSIFFYGLLIHHQAFACVYTLQKKVSLKITMHSNNNKENTHFNQLCFIINDYLPKNIKYLGIHVAGIFQVTGLEYPYMKIITGTKTQKKEGFHGKVIIFNYKQNRQYCIKISPPKNLSKYPFYKNQINEWAIWSKYSSFIHNKKEFKTAKRIGTEPGILIGTNEFLKKNNSTCNNKQVDWKLVKQNKMKNPDKKRKSTYLFDVDDLE